MKINKKREEGKNLNNKEKIKWTKGWTNDYSLNYRL